MSNQSKKLVHFIAKSYEDGEKIIKEMDTTIIPSEGAIVAIPDEDETKYYYYRVVNLRYVYYPEEVLIQVICEGL